MIRGEGLFCTPHGKRTPHALLYRSHCFSNGAYRGAGADSLRQRFRIDPGAAAPQLSELPDGVEGKNRQLRGPLQSPALLCAAAERERHRLSTGDPQGLTDQDPQNPFYFPAAGDSPEAADAELQRAIGQLAELALLGAGHATDLFPESLDELYAAAADEAFFRVLL